MRRRRSWRRRRRGLPAGRRRGRGSRQQPDRTGYHTRRQVAEVSRADDGGSAGDTYRTEDSPPSESCSSRVSFESLYGMWETLRDSSPSAEMTLPSASCGDGRDRRVSRTAHETHTGTDGDTYMHRCQHNTLPRLYINGCHNEMVVQMGDVSVADTVRRPPNTRSYTETSRFGHINVTQLKTKSMATRLTCRHSYGLVSVAGSTVCGHITQYSDCPSNTPCPYHTNFTECPHQLHTVAVAAGPALTSPQLMEMPSLALSPVAPVLFRRSEPARSTK